MRKKIGDRFYIRSKIIPYDDFDARDPKDYYRVCTSCNNGYERFVKDKCDVEGEYVIHEVYVTGYDHYSDGTMTYHVKNVDNGLSTSGSYGWQGCCDEDIVVEVVIE